MSQESFQNALKQIESRADQSLSAKAQLFTELYAFLAHEHRPIILVTRSPAELLVRLKNLRFFLEHRPAIMRAIPADERTVFHATSADPMIRMEGMATKFRLGIGEMPAILLMPPEALLERCPTIEALNKHAQLLIAGQKLLRDKLIEALLLMGYSRVNQVLERGTFAIRGSIIDIFASGEKRPIRLDLFGDDIESIKYFDENTQRSLNALESIVVGGIKEIFLDDESIERANDKLTHLGDLINYPTLKLNEKLRDINNGVHFYGMEKLLPAFFAELSSPLELILSTHTPAKLPHIIFDDQASIMDHLKSFQTTLEDSQRQAAIRGDLVFAQTDYFLSTDELLTLISKFSKTDILTLQKNRPEQSFASSDTTDIRADILKESVVTKDEEPHLLKPLARRVKELHRQQFFTIIAVSSKDHQQELKRLLEPFGINLSGLSALPSLTDPLLFKPHIHAYVLVSKAPLAFGGVFDFLRLALIAEDDIFGKRTKRKDQSGKQKGFGTSISDLEPSDLVVHVDHGIGMFKGLVRLNLRGVENDYILLIYANDEKLYLPTHRINLIKPHGQKAGTAQKLDKLGGTAWQSKKKKVKEAVMAMAQDLLKLYARREVVERPPFMAPDAHYVEFEANFAFETTHDQQKAIDDVIADLQKKRPMDRLVCGDVGYGKTEVAMRAAMLSVLSRRQVAILAPTTVLAQQHGITFNQRFHNTGMNIAVLSRFQKAKEITEILKKVQANQVDIIIGTHRLLSPDVHFHDLGLIVIDEEQRFGIKAKEHLKRMRTKVDVLTMSATPIPRTMQMSYFGIRDLSIIETPPVDRRAIETQVVRFDDALIKEAVHRELSRGGQVYFVHNRVQTIQGIADYLKVLVPEAKIAVAHGQMGEQDLEAVMLSFLSHDVNILVCTTIIETGIDVPTANTMFINDADDFGLSQLYQLRGRIGRSPEKAFAYLLIKQEAEHLTPIARTRLEILHKFSELGAGFRIAQHDLELRGAGDLLGKNQHGHMAAVGYDLYAELLKEAVKELKGQAEDDVDPEVILPISALIPEKYCPELHERLSFYQRLAGADSKEKIDLIMLDFADLYGEAPLEVWALRASALIKLALKKIHGLKLELSRSKDERTLSVGINLSPKALIDHQKLLQFMKDDSPLKITPQHKVIQLVHIQEAVTHEAVLQASLTAIDRIKAELLS